MPRVNLKKRQYHITDFTKWLVGKMYENGLRQQDLAEMLGIKQPAMSIKLKEGNYTYSEVLVLINQLGATDEEIVKLMRM